MGTWKFLTNHARVLLFVAGNPGARLRDLAAGLDITERTVFGIVGDLTEAGYLVKEKHGRRNRYEIQGELSLRESMTPKRTIGEVLDVLSTRVEPNGQGGDVTRRVAAPPDAPTAT